MSAALAAPDERTFRDHLAEGDFQLGIARGWWKCIDQLWPTPIFAVTAAPRTGAPEEYHFRLDLTGYPASAPTGQLWDVATWAPLALHLWPTGTDRFIKVFRREWHGGSCLYMPADRRSMDGHPDWPGRYPSQWWTSSRTFSHYLRVVHELLNSSSYSGLQP